MKEKFIKFLVNEIYSKITDTHTKDDIHLVFYWPKDRRDDKAFRWMPPVIQRLKLDEVVSSFASNTDCYFIVHSFITSWTNYCRVVLEKVTKTDINVYICCYLSDNDERLRKIVYSIPYANISQNLKIPEIIVW